MTTACTEVPGRLDDERRALAAEGFPTAMAVARSWTKKFPGLRDEFESAATEACCVAARSYRAAAGSFGAFVRLKARYACLQAHRVAYRAHLRKVKVRAATAEIRGAANPRNPLDYRLHPAAPDPFGAAERRIDGLALERMIGLARESSREALRIVYAEGIDPRDAAPMLGVTRQAVYYKLWSGYSDIRRQLPKGLLM